MGQNPYDQNQQSPFDQPQENPFGGSTFDNQPMGGFGSPGGFNQPIQPEKRGGGFGRACLIVLGLTLVCCLACGGVLAYVALTNKPAVPAVAWIQLAGQGDADQTAGIVCEDSAAETFSVLFALVPGVSNVSIDGDNYTIDNDNNLFRTSGEITYANGTVPYEFEFVIDPDGPGASLGPFGCITEIRDLSGTVEKLELDTNNDTPAEPDSGTDTNDTNQ